MTALGPWSRFGLCFNEMNGIGVLPVLMRVNIATCPFNVLCCICNYFELCLVLYVESKVLHHSCNLVGLLQ